MKPATIGHSATTFRPWRRTSSSAPATNRVEYIVLAHHALAVAHEMQQEIEYLRLELNPHPAPGELASALVEDMIAKEKNALPLPLRQANRLEKQSGVPKT